MVTPALGTKQAKLQEVLLGKAETGVAGVDSHVCWGFTQQESGLEMERSKACVELKQGHHRSEVLNKTVIQQEGREETAGAKGRVTTSSNC